MCGVWPLLLQFDCPVLVELRQSAPRCEPRAAIRAAFCGLLRAWFVHKKLDSAHSPSPVEVKQVCAPLYEEASRSDGRRRRRFIDFASCERHAAIARRSFAAGCWGERVPSVGLGAGDEADDGRRGASIAASDADSQHDDGGDGSR